MIFAACDRSPGARPIASSEEGLRKRVALVQARARRLAEEVMSFWKQKGADAEFGGFLGNLDRRGNKSAPTYKGLVQQTRHLWAFSNWYERREPTAPVRALADTAYRFVVQHMYDPTSKQFHYAVDERGAVVVDARKLLYAESFAILGLSTYARVFGVAEANRYAIEAFRAIDTKHDARYGGYDENNDSGWLQPGAQKGTNTHIHLMEAFTSLYESTHDPVVRARLEELVDVVRTKIFQAEKRYAATDFKNDWTPVGPPKVSYGHDLETAWLLWEAGCVLGRPDDVDIRAASLGMGLSSALQGYDAHQGGYFDHGIPEGPVMQTDKIWWVEAEALPGLWLLYRLTGDVSLLDKLEGTIGFIEKFQRDNEQPGTEWFWGITKDGAINDRGDHKGEEWKASYHNSRALTLLDAWIDDALK